MNNKQQIEQFINMHRDAFDTYPSPACGWETLECTLDRIHGDPLAQFIATNRVEFDTNDCSGGVWNKVEAGLGDMKIKAAPDAVELFIRNNREDFDVDTPDLRVWEQLSKRKMPLLKVNWTRQIIRSAAAVSLLIAGVGIGMWYSSNQQQRLAGMRMSDVSAEYAELEQHFERDIDAKKQHLAQFTSNTSSSADVLSDLSQMDKVMEELRHELAKVPPGNREEVIRAMIDNYTTKAKVLERVLKALEEHHTNNSNNDDHDDQNSSSKHENVRI